MTSPIAKDPRGNELLALTLGTEDDLDHVDAHLPLPLALVVARRGASTLLVLNRWRQEWELPGGMIDDGESPREAALRELVEETGGSATALEYCGVATFRLMPDHRLERAAVYATELTGTAPFEPNDEIERIGWWDEEEMSTPPGLDPAIARLLVAQDA